MTVNAAKSSIQLALAHRNGTLSLLAHPNFYSVYHVLQWLRLVVHSTNKYWYHYEFLITHVLNPFCQTCFKVLLVEIFTENCDRWCQNMCGCLQTTTHSNRWRSPLSYPSQSQLRLAERQRTLAVNWSRYFRAILQAREKASRALRCTRKNGLSPTWRFGRIYFSPHGNLFRILRSGDRLEHTQGMRPECPGRAPKARFLLPSVVRWSVRVVYNGVSGPPRGQQSYVFPLVPTSGVHPQSVPVSLISSICMSPLSPTLP